MIDWRRARVWLKHKAGSADANFFEISPSFAQISGKKSAQNSAQISKKNRESLIKPKVKGGGHTLLPSTRGNTPSGAKQRGWAFLLAHCAWKLNKQSTHPLQSFVWGDRGCVGCCACCGPVVCFVLLKQPPTSRLHSVVNISQSMVSQYLSSRTHIGMQLDVCMLEGHASSSRSAFTTVESVTVEIAHLDPGILEALPHSGACEARTGHIQNARDGCEAAN